MAVECASDAELLISELVANCVRHAGLPSGEEISLAIYLDEFRLRVEVADNGRGFSELGTTGAEDGGASGWGLLLVQRLADDWGVETDPGVGTTVWFEMPLSPRDV